MSNNNAEIERRSPLCATCGDLTFHSKSAKILVYLLLFLILGYVGYFYLFPISEINSQFFISIFVMIGIFGFGVFVLLYVVKSEQKKE